MALSPRELEDEIILAHNEVRNNPNILINELEAILGKDRAYYTPSTHLSTLIGSQELDEIVSYSNLNHMISFCQN